MKSSKKARTESPDDLSDDTAGGDITLVGIGASAGGVQALREFFTNVTPGSGISYVVILHLSPDHESALAQVLQTVSKLPVTVVTQQVEVERDAVYVISPNHHLTMDKGSISASENMDVDDRRAPIDIFFRTLAESHRSQAVCVILSGTGADGSMGLKRVKERGGVVFVQNPREAEYNDMPRAAIATDLVDAVLNVGEIPVRIAAYNASRGKIKIADVPPPHPELFQVSLRDILTQLRVRTGHDFSNYKRPTLLRRIERRTNVRQLADLPAYAAYLREHPDEAQALLKDLLISVTNFFRDKESFAVVESDILPAIFTGKTAADQVRVWVAGCATGEEAYSLAMMIAERLQGLVDAPSVQIFATDIDEAAIATARDGLYTINDAADVSPDRLRRFFSREGDAYRIRRDIREMVLFASHNVIKDAPFSHLDLVTCRNLLIYLNNTAQERVLSTFHFALKPGSFLFLGNSESTDGTSDMFSSFRKDQHIFQSRHTKSRRPYPIPETVPLPKAQAPRFAITTDGERKTPERITYADLHRQLLEQYAPPSVVVNEEYEIVHLSESAGRYMILGGGEPSNNLLKLVRPELRLELRSALYQAVQRGTNVEAKGLRIALENGIRTVNILVRPVLRAGDAAKGFSLVLFENGGDAAVPDEAAPLSATEPVAHLLEEELMRSKAYIRSSTEQYETQAEELKASNEELQAMNEELRSTAEELETSKEELQSINEELVTVNQELKVKIEELSQSNNNFQNLINSTDIGTIFLDRSFRVNLFSPAARSIFSLIPADIGRPLADITHRLKYPHLLRDAAHVAETLQPASHEVETADGHYFMMQLLPYRTADDYINGIVITFVDITSRKKAETALHRSHERLEMAMEAGRLYSWEIDPATKAVTWSGNIGSVLGFPIPADMTDLDELLQYMVHTEDCGRAATELHGLMKSGGAFASEFRVVNPATGEINWLSNVGALMASGEGGATRCVGISQNITERKLSGETLRANEEQLRLTMESALDYAIIGTDIAGRIENWSRGAEKIFGYMADEVQGQSGDIIFTPQDRAAGVPEHEMEQARTEGRATDERWHLRRDGSRFYMSGITSPILNNQGGVSGYVKVARDMTEEQAAAEDLRQSEERHRIVLEAAEMGAWDWNVETGEVTWNDRHHELVGIAVNNETKTYEYFAAFVHPDDSTDVREKLMRAVDEPVSFQAEFRIIRANDGGTRWMSGYGKAVSRTAAGRAMRITGGMFDITLRKEMEAARIQAEEQLKLALSASSIGIWIRDMRTDKIIWSKEQEALFGLKPGTFEGTPQGWEDRVHPNDLPGMNEASIPVDPAAEHPQTEYRVIWPDGSIHWLMDKSRIYYNSAGEPEYMMGANIDITERKNVEQQKEEFLGVASHELKTPVTSIKAYTEVLRDMFDERQDAESVELIEKLDTQVDRMTRLIRDLLDATRINEGQLHLQPELLDLNKLVITTVEELQLTARNHKLVLELEPLPEVQADRERIVQVLNNILSNAIKYSPDANEVRIRSAFKKDYVEICIQDAGVGLSEEAAPRIFERFFRAPDPHVSTFPGMGLGLYIAAEIVKQHKGGLSVKSKKGEGAIFCLTLPIEHAATRHS